MEVRSGHLYFTQSNKYCNSSSSSPLTHSCSIRKDNLSLGYCSLNALFTGPLLPGTFFRPWICIYLNQYQTHTHLESLSTPPTIFCRTFMHPLTLPSFVWIVYTVVPQFLTLFPPISFYKTLNNNYTDILKRLSPAHSFPFSYTNEQNDDENTDATEKWVKNRRYWNSLNHNL